MFRNSNTKIYEECGRYILVWVVELEKGFSFQVFAAINTNCKMPLNLPICRKLQDGDAFDFGTLAENLQETEDFWDWWWEGRSYSQISFPKTIQDSDPILVPTATKRSVDLTTFNHFFGETLLAAIDAGVFSAGENQDRIQFRERAKELLGFRSLITKTPQIVFAGGGYGSGKTSTLSFYCEQGKFGDFEKKHILGVDQFKLLTPENHLIARVSDGRGSRTVQEECKVMADELFNQLIGTGRSFIWDSSMSNMPDTLARINAAKAKAYDISLFAVLTPLPIAVEQAMERARATGRFPHENALPKSHRDFRENLLSFIPLFDDITLLANRSVKGDLVLCERETPAALAGLDRNEISRLLDV